jgi:hypothetical protein
VEDKQGEITWVETAKQRYEKVERVLGFLRRRKLDYQRVFGGEPAKPVLADLARFCRANETTFQPDARLHAVLEGRREVWLRIQNHLNLQPAQLAEIFNRPIGGEHE